MYKKAYFCYALFITKTYNMKALIIDDEVDICYLLGDLLRKKNLQSNFANSIEEAKQVLEANNPEIVFLDNHLPDGKGVEFAYHIKQKYPGVKLVMITAYDTANDRKLAYSKGVDCFIAKPFTHEIVYKALDDFEN